MRTRRRVILAALAGSAWLATVLLARPGVIVTQSGARYEGDITERGDDVIVTIRGVQTTVPRVDVATLEYSAAFEEEFAARLAKLEANDVDGRIELAKWAMKQEKYVAARDALDAALAINPNSREAVDLQNLVRSQMRLAAQSQLRTPAKESPVLPPVASGTKEAESNVSASSSGPRSMLSADDIQAIRRIEWRTDDLPVRVRVDSKAARSYADLKQMRWEDFAKIRPVEQARMILEDPNSTTEQRRGVLVISDPPSIAEYRRVVQPIILSGCASSGCHGSPNSKFRLITPANSDEATYTNFYLLNSYTRQLDRQRPAGGIFGGATELRMIDRGHGDKSLLLQYCLPPELAEFDHPRVLNYQPLFQSLNDPKARAVLGWIDRSLRLNPADYGIQFSLSPEATGPTTAPAAGGGR